MNTSLRRGVKVLAEYNLMIKTPFFPSPFALHAEYMYIASSFFTLVQREIFIAVDTK